jgi:hypothetical protein
LLSETVEIQRATRSRGRRRELLALLHTTRVLDTALKELIGRATLAHRWGFHSLWTGPGYLDQGWHPTVLLARVAAEGLDLAATARALRAEGAAVVKLVAKEPESTALRHFVGRRRELVASALVRTELNRAVLGLGERFHRRVTEVLKRIDLVRVNNQILDRAGANFRDVVEFTTYLVGRESIAPFLEARAQLFPSLYPDGDSPYNQYCAHWFTEHPDFADGGLVAVAWYEHGVRFLDVGEDGMIEEVGWFVPLGGSTSAAYWVTDEIVYTTDYQRGFDILRFTDEPAGGETAPPLVGQVSLPSATLPRPDVSTLLGDDTPFTCRLR